mmetsp:Transcript_44914/g.57508  ORF Transcript_44914/g.57508 Transcript_44914/m.57508 type:complete len:579 (+) Transcript_44914:73-1809(+)
MSDDEYGEDSFDDSRAPTPAKPSSRGPPQSMIPAKELTEQEMTELEELQKENEALLARIRDYEVQGNVIDELENKIENMKAQVKAANLNAGAIKERDKLRQKVKTMSEEHRDALEKANADRDSYEETKRLVDAQTSLVTTVQDLDKLKAAHSELVSDCNIARASLLSELLADSGGNNNETVAYLDQVGQNHENLLTKAADGAGKSGGVEESSVARKARRAIDCGQSKSKGRSLDPNNYQFVKIGELVRLRLDKKERECQRLITEMKMSGASGGGGGGRLGVGGTTSTGLMSATKARIPDETDSNALTTTNGDGGGDGNHQVKDATAMVMQLEKELDIMKNKNRKLENRCNGLERELQNALGAADDLVVLKSKAIQLLERQKMEKELRLTAEGATKIANRKVLALAQHIEKLMLHLKHEAASKAKAQDSAGRASQEVQLMRARSATLVKRASARDQVIVELKEGAKILEDQLRLMDEKYMELRTKLDYTRQSTGRDVIKYKQVASQLRTKWALLSASMPGQPTLLDEVEVNDTQAFGGSSTASEAVSQALSVSFGPETGENVSLTRGKGRSRSASSTNM